MQWPLAETIRPEKLKKSCCLSQTSQRATIYIKIGWQKVQEKMQLICKSAVIYSDYFFPKGYEDGVKNSLLGLPQNRILNNKSAVPSSNLPHGGKFWIRIKFKSYWTSNKGMDLFTRNRNNNKFRYKKARVKNLYLNL